MSENAQIERLSREKEFVPLCVPEIRGNEWDYVKQCLDTGWVSSAGSFVTQLEATVAQLSDQKHGVATNSGTSALHLALLVAGVGEGDEVLVSDLTFVAPVNAVRYVGAEPVLVDCDPKTWQMDVELVREFLLERCEFHSGQLRNKQSGRRIAALVPVHILGGAVDVEPLVELAEKFQIPVIEDATEALGATYRGRPIGAFGHAACFSFNGNKIVTAGGGGVLVTGNAQWAARARHLSTQAKQDPVRYIHDEVGYNYRLTNIQAALGVAQLERLEDFVQRKRFIAAKYRQCLDGISGVSLPPESPFGRDTCWMFTVTLDANVLGKTRDQVMAAMEERAIQTRPLWKAIHQNVPFAESQRILSAPAWSSHLADCSLSLPCSVGLTEPQQSRVIHEFIQACSR